MPRELKVLYRMVAAGQASFDDLIELLRRVQDQAADIRVPLKDEAPQDGARFGAVVILGEIIDTLSLTRKNLTQRPADLNNEAS